jgi:hypothetical protein
VLWTLAMTWDVVLVVFYHYEPERLRRLEKKYLVVITTLTFIPALVFLFVRDSDKGPIYGSVVVSLGSLPKTVFISMILIDRASSGAPSPPTGFSSGSYSTTRRYGMLPFFGT